MKLYKLTTINHSHHFVAAENPTEAEEKLKNKIKSLNYSDSFSKVRHIELIADEYEYGFSENGLSRHILFIK